MKRNNPVIVALVIKLWIILLWSHAAFAQNPGLLCYDCDMIDDPMNCNQTAQCQPGEVCSISRMGDEGGLTYYTARCVNATACHDLETGAVHTTPAAHAALLGKRTESRVTIMCIYCCHGNLCNDECKTSPGVTSTTTTELTAPTAPNMVSSTIAPAITTTTASVPLTSTPSPTAAGLMCYDCDLIDDPKTCSKTTRCHASEVCTISRMRDGTGPVYYSSRCMNETACRTMMLGNHDVHTTPASVHTTPASIHTTPASVHTTPVAHAALLGKRVASTVTIMCVSCCTNDLCNDECVTSSATSSLAPMTTPLPSVASVTYPAVTSPIMTFPTTTTTIATATTIATTTQVPCNDLSDLCHTPETLSTICMSPATAKEYCPKACGFCPVNGHWTDWSSWTGCSATCGAGSHRMRVRQCTNPPPANGGTDCSGITDETEACNTAPCPIDGQWNSWTPWTNCPATCGVDNFVYRLRVCDNPAPQYNGADCVGHSTEHTECSNSSCPIDGQWSSWSKWTKCSATCGLVSKRFRYRECNNPSPANGGADCGPSESVDEEICNSSPCPIDGQWNAWSVWSSCLMTCGLSNQRYRARECNNPSPQYNGSDCVGLGVENKECHSAPCPIDGQWTTWSNWTSCSDTCGSDGHIFRYRQCNNPAPQYSGSYCAGADSENSGCDTHIPCPIDGQWGGWTAWTVCSATCGNGHHQFRLRKCDSPAPDLGGKSCLGSDGEMRECNNPPCVTDTTSVTLPQWADWGAWTGCSKTCGTGAYRYKIRECIHPTDGNKDHSCDGDFTIREECTLSPCLK